MPEKITFLSLIIFLPLNFSLIWKNIKKTKFFDYSTIFYYISKGFFKNSQNIKKVLPFDSYIDYFEQVYYNIMVKLWEMCAKCPHERKNCDE